MVKRVSVESLHSLFFVYHIAGECSDVSTTEFIFCHDINFQLERERGEDVPRRSPYPSTHVADTLIFTASKMVAPLDWGYTPSTSSSSTQSQSTTGSRVSKKGGGGDSNRKKSKKATPASVSDPICNLMHRGYNLEDVENIMDMYSLTPNSSHQLMYSTKNNAPAGAQGCSSHPGRDKRDVKISLGGSAKQPDLYCGLPIDDFPYDGFDGNIMSGPASYDYDQFTMSMAAEQQCGAGNEEGDGRRSSGDDVVPRADESVTVASSAAAVPSSSSDNDGGRGSTKSSKVTAEDPESPSTVAVSNKNITDTFAPSTTSAHDDYDDNDNNDSNDSNDDGATRNRSRNNNYNGSSSISLSLFWLDVVSFVLAGLLLILVMEQFIQIGVYIGSSSPRGMTTLTGGVDFAPRLYY